MATLHVRGQSARQNSLQRSLLGVDSDCVSCPLLSPAWGKAQIPNHALYTCSHRLLHCKTLSRFRAHSTCLSITSSLHTRLRECLEGDAVLIHEPGHVSLCARRAHLLVPCQCRSDRVSLSYCTDTPTYSFLLLQCSASAHFPLPLLSPHSGVGFQPAPSNIPIRRSTTYADVRVVFICTPCSYPAHLPDRTE